MLFNWFQPTCPVAPREKVWVEQRFRFLAEAFGVKRLLQAKVILPTAEFFPFAYQGDTEDAERLFGQICDYMQINVNDVELRFYRQTTRPSALGFYEEHESRPVINISDTVVDSAAACAATMTHELCHYLLLHGGKIATTEWDHEKVTDLLQVFLGLGVFAANEGVVETTWRMGRVSYWSIGKHGYLSLRMYAYAFALFAWARDETSPPWFAHLRPDVVTAARQGLNFLQRTDDCLFQPHSGGRDLERETAAALEGLLRRGTPGERVGAMLALQQRESPGAACVPALRACLAAKDRDLRAEAAKTLGALGPAAEASIDDLLRALDDQQREVQIDAALALGQIGLESARVLPNLVSLMGSSIEEIAIAAVNGIAAFGPAAGACLPQLLTALRDAWTKADFRRSDALIAAVRAVEPQPNSLFEKAIAGLDDDVANMARLSLQTEVSSPAESAGETDGPA